MREMGGELLKALRTADADKIQQLQRAEEANVNNYDRDTLLKTGIVSWTYPPNLGELGPNGEGTDNLDEPTAVFLAKEIFDFSRPESAESAKNVSGASTVT